MWGQTTGGGESGRVGSSLAPNEAEERGALDRPTFLVFRASEPNKRRDRDAPPIDCPARSCAARVRRALLQRCPWRRQVRFRHAFQAPQCVCCPSLLLLLVSVTDQNHLQTWRKDRRTMRTRTVRRCCRTTASCIPCVVWRSRATTSTRYARCFTRLRYGDGLATD